MLAALAFGPNRSLVAHLQQACSTIPDMYLYKVLYHFPQRYELLQLLNAFSPRIVFVELDSDEGLQIAREISVHSPQTAVIGFTQRADKQHLLNVRDAGVADILQSPLDPEMFQKVLARVLLPQGSGTRNPLLAFLPAKAGSGSTTTALMLASCLVEHWKLRILLMEADLNSGPLSFLLNLNHERSIVDALENSTTLSDATWPTLTASHNGIAVLPAPKATKVPQYSRWNYQVLLGFVRARYDAVFADLPEVIDEASEDLVSQAAAVYLVCTPDISSLFLARKRLYALQEHGVPDGRIRIVLNRHQGRSFSVEQVEQILGRRLAAVLPEDPEVQAITFDGRLSADHLPLRGALLNLACAAFGLKAPSAPIPQERTGLRSIFRPGAFQAP